MHRRFARNLGYCFRDLGIAAAYALAASILITLIEVVDDRSLGLAWILFDVAALPVGVMALICGEALVGALQEQRALRQLGIAPGR